MFICQSSDRTVYRIRRYQCITARQSLLLPGVDNGCTILILGQIIDRCVPVVCCIQRYTLVSINAIRQQFDRQAGRTKIILVVSVYPFFLYSCFSYVFRIGNGCFCAVVSIDVPDSAVSISFNHIIRQGMGHRPAVFSIQMHRKALPVFPIIFPVVRCAQNFCINNRIISVRADDIRKFPERIEDTNITAARKAGIAYTNGSNIADRSDSRGKRRIELNRWFITCAIPVVCNDYSRIAFIYCKLKCYRLCCLVLILTKQIHTVIIH